jgi:hypothetical protein
MPKNLRDRLNLAPKPALKAPPRAPAAPPRPPAEQAGPTPGNGPARPAKAPPGPSLTLACGHARPLPQATTVTL